MTDKMSATNEVRGASDCSPPSITRRSRRLSDTERLNWLLANMNQKGFDEKACGICDRNDIDAAILQENAEAKYTT